MKRMTLTLGLTVALGIAIGVIGPLNAQEQEKRTGLLKTDLVGMEGKTISVDLLEFAPGWVGSKDYHAGHLVVYVLEGSLTVEKEGEPSATIAPGGVFYGLPEHLTKAKNASRADGVKMLMFQISEKGKETRISGIWEIDPLED